MKNTVRVSVTLIALVALVVTAFLFYRSRPRGPQPGTVLDEAMQAHRAPESFPPADEDYFHDMDQDRNGPVTLTPEEIMGRNTWLVWTAGNDRLWDRIGVSSLGALDFLKTISSYPNPISSDPKNRMKFSRDNRWEYLGLVNEPGFEKATGPDPERFGLWLDKRSADAPPDPFENESKYPGVQVGARGKKLPDGRTLPVGSLYGYATGIVGLRLFPNPDFDEAAARKWDPERYYSDPKYYNSKDLVRPYRVGMSCAFCHVGPNPLKPPADPEKPRWENLSSNVGAQYFWVDRIFDWKANPSNYVYQMFHTSRPGTLDTSLISSDNINNPRTMNAIYNLGPRLDQALRMGKETLGGGSLHNKQLNDYVPADSPLARYFNRPATVWSPRVLKDGADSVGPLGALNRVYLNIGLFSEEWLLHFNPLVGGRTVTPIEITVARKNSTYWLATEAQTPNMALFFLRTSGPHRLQDAPGGEAYLTKDAATLERGKIVFAENCARCHSSKLPTPTVGLEAGGGSGADYLKCWEAYWTWTRTEDFKSRMRAIVTAPDFLDNNYLSAEFRVPLTLLRTNACSPMASNAIRGNIWDNFSSDTYKDLPPVGRIHVYNPATGDPYNPVPGDTTGYPVPGGGRGYTRPASLVSLWSTAPFLLNNSVGTFNSSPSVEARMECFQDAIEKMLWPEKREQDPVLVKAFAEKKIMDFPGLIDRTTERSYLLVKTGYVPDNLKAVVGLGEWLVPRFFGKGEDRGDIEIGPIPAGTPVGLLANLMVRPEETDLAARLKHDGKLLKLAKGLKSDLRALGKDPGDEEARRVFSARVGQMMDLSRCPDYIVNRGHYFGTGYFANEPGLSDEDKRALIEFLKTF